MTNDKKVAIISGGMGGVGYATAEALARENYRVVVLYRNSKEEEITAARKNMPGDHIFIRCDLRNSEEVTRTLDDVLACTGRIDIAVHAAVDPIVRERLLNMDDCAFRSQFDAGFFGAFNFFQTVAKTMKQQHNGTIVGITSSVIESEATPARMGAYTVEKIALRGLLREMHRELFKDNIRVFAVAPGLMRTGLNADLPEKFFEMVQERSGGAALMTPDDVANVIVRLCSSDEKISSGISYLLPSGNITPL